VKPGANMSEVTNTVKEELQSLKSDDFVVIWGGANNIRKNNTKAALKLLYVFVTDHRDPNIVIINSPHTYDLKLESCVNQEVSKFNRKLNKIMKPQAHVKVLELELDRKHFTRRGLHLNS
jgi:predicted metallo-beta-lactamase superfamily hydrolase